jgi:hypothetical protein
VPTHAAAAAAPPLLPPTDNLERCLHCERVRTATCPLKRCALCYSAAFCDERCQRACYQAHKPHCLAKAAELAQAGAVLRPRRRVSLERSGTWDVPFSGSLAFTHLAAALPPPQRAEDNPFHHRARDSMYEFYGLVDTSKQRMARWPLRELAAMLNERAGGGVATVATRGARYARAMLREVQERLLAGGVISFTMHQGSALHASLARAALGPMAAHADDEDMQRSGFGALLVLLGFKAVVQHEDIVASVLRTGVRALATHPFSPSVCLGPASIVLRLHDGLAALGWRRAAAAVGLMPALACTLRVHRETLADKVCAVANVCSAIKLLLKDDDGSCDDEQVRRAWECHVAPELAHALASGLQCNPILADTALNALRCMVAGSTPAAFSAAHEAVLAGALPSVVAMLEWRALAGGRVCDIVLATEICDLLCNITATGVPFDTLERALAHKRAAVDAGALPQLARLLSDGAAPATLHNAALLAVKNVVGVLMTRAGFTYADDGATARAQAARDANLPSALRALVAQDHRLREGENYYPRFVERLLSAITRPGAAQDSGESVIQLGWD